MKISNIFNRIDKANTTKDSLNNDKEQYIIFMLTILFKEKTCVHADVLYLFFFFVSSSKSIVLKILNHVTSIAICTVSWGGRTVSALMKLKNWKKEENLIITSLGSDTVSQLLFVCEKLLQGSREPHCHEYFSPRTNVCHIYL